MIKKITESTWFYFFCVKLFVLNTFPVLTEPMAAISIVSGSIWTPWSLIALTYMMIMMEVDFFIISRPFHLQSKSWLLKAFEKLSPYIPFNIYIMSLAVRKAITVFKEEYANAKKAFISKETAQKQWYKTVLLICAYVSIFLIAVVPGLGRISHGMYARKKQRFVFGRPLLYGACFVRYYVVFTLLKLGITIFDLL